jgi:glutathione synthase/RimK-type ligase-like ATP-grasp enzyme
MRVAVLRCNALPSFVTWPIPNVAELFADDRLLIAEFAQRGVEASSVVWGDPNPDWNQYDLALIRSTWDYIDDLARFVTVLSAIEASACRLFNPLDAVRWNSDKSYLFDLNDWGVPIVPTLRVSTTDLASVADTVAREGWHSVVVKPIIGAGGSAVRRVAAAEIGGTLKQLAAQHPQHEFLVQPLIESVITEGEWSFIFIDGEVSHVLLKKPAAGDYRAHGIYGGTIESAAPRQHDLRHARAMLARLPFDLLYARLDLVRIDGHLAAMELELIEPMLYFDLAREGVGQLVDATIARLREP